MGWDPRDQGARCDECPLREEREGGPVPAEWPSRPIALLVGEAPGETEVAKGRPFCGKAGLELMSALGSVGIARSHVALTNVVACRPPENKYDLIVHRLQRENKRREKADLDPIPTPAQCCRPRLLTDLSKLPKIVALAIALPLIVLWTDAVALLGGMVSANAQLGIGYRFFLSRLPDAVPIANLWLGLGKGVVFGILIALIACHFGLRIRPNTESLAIGTTNSVVAAITIVIIVDAIFAVMFSDVGVF